MDILEEAGRVLADRIKSSGIAGYSWVSDRALDRLEAAIDWHDQRGIDAAEAQLDRAYGGGEPLGLRGAA